MNPFKYKNLEEFTIDDCESYISRYPYGEKIAAVKRQLRILKKNNTVPVSQTPDNKQNSLHDIECFVTYNASNKQNADDRGYEILRNTQKSDEEILFEKCNISVFYCESYLKKYPKGKYVSQVKAIIESKEVHPSGSNNSGSEGIGFGNLMVRLILSALLIALIIVLIPTIIGAPISVMVAFPAFKSIWEGKCDFFD